MQDMMLKTPTAMDAEIGSPKSEPKSGNSGCLAQEIMGGYAVILPTPTAMSVRHPGRVSAAKAQGSVSFRSRLNGEEAPTGLEDWLEFHGLLPTLVSLDGTQRGPNARKQGLPGYFHDLLHTPIADDLKKRTNGQRSMTKRDFEEMFPEKAKSQGSKDGRASQLNPLFVGEMMGFPLEWLVSPFLSGDGEGRP